jgi:hypothetical protein
LEETSTPEKEEENLGELGKRMNPGKNTQKN